MSHSSEAALWERLGRVDLSGTQTAAKLATKQGPIIMEVTIAADGNVRKVDVVEAADELAAADLARLIGSWSFASTRGSTRGTLTFVLRPRVANNAEFEVIIPARAVGPTMAAAGWSLPQSASVVDVDEVDVSRLDSVVIDVRRRELFAQGHRSGAINLPLASLTPESASLVSGRTVLLDCSYPEPRNCRLASWVISRAGAKTITIIVRAR